MQDACQNLKENETTFETIENNGVGLLGSNVINIYFNQCGKKTVAFCYATTTL